MNRPPATLYIINRDLSRARTLARNINYSNLTRTEALLLLDRFYAIKKRALRCRFVTGAPARKLRATILRASFQCWRTVIRRLARMPGLHNWAANHLTSLSQQYNLFDPNDWVIRLLGTDPGIFLGVIPTITENAPTTARSQPCDPYWRCLKLKLSTARL